MNHSLQIGVREGVCCGVCGVVWGVCCDGVCWACVGFLGEKILLAPLYYPDTFASLYGYVFSLDLSQLSSN